MPIEQEGPSTGLSGRFSAVTEKLRQSSALATPTTDEKKGFDRFRRERTVEQDNTSRAAKIDAATSEIFKTLADSSLDPKEQAEKIAELLYFNEEDLEANGKSVAENQAMVAELLRKFIEHNKESLALTRDNPLSELRTGIRSVFDEYHIIDTDRSGIKDKMTLIDDIIKKYGGPEGLIKALLSAKDKEIEKKALDDAIAEARSKVESLTGDVRGLDARSQVLATAIATDESDPLLFFKAEKKRKLSEDRRERAKLEADLQIKREDLTSATTTLTEKSSALQSFVSTEDYQIHEQILGVLDIGTDDFKQKLMNLAEVTMSYIDNTSDILEGIRMQLGKLLDRAVDVHTMTQNTVEHTAILLEAQQMAQKHNTTRMQELEAEEVTGGVAGMKKEKKLRALHQHISSLERTTQSTASVSGELGKVQIGLTNFKDQMQEGLADSIEQEMLATGTAAMNGNATAMRMESLATFVQGLVAKGLYMREAENYLGEMAKEMERSLSSRVAKNEGIRNVADILKEMTDAMDEKNDIVLEVATQRKELIERLINQTRELGRTNEEALAIESEVNRKLYDAPEVDEVKGGQPVGGAPSAPTLG